jgi:hypothetical protein
MTTDTMDNEDVAMSNGKTIWLPADVHERLKQYHNGEFENSDAVPIYRSINHLLPDKGKK